AAGDALGGEGDGPAVGGVAADGFGAGGVAVADGLAVGVGDDQSPAGGGVAGGGGGEGADDVAVHRAVAGDVAGPVGQAEQGGQRQRQVDGPGQRRQRGDRGAAAQPKRH